MWSDSPETSLQCTTLRCKARRDMAVREPAYPWLDSGCLRVSWSDPESWIDTGHCDSACPNHSWQCTIDHSNLYDTHILLVCVNNVRLSYCFNLFYLFLRTIKSIWVWLKNDFHCHIIKGQYNVNKGQYSIYSVVKNVYFYLN